MNKKAKILLTVLSIVILASITALVLINKTLKPITTSQELFSKINYDLSESFTNLSNYQLTISDIFTNESIKVIDEEKQIVNMSRSERYKKVVNEIITECDKIINYDTKGLSKAVLEYVEYAKLIATETKEYHANSLQEMNLTEFDTKLNEYTNDFTNVKMKKLTELLNEARLEVYGETSIED